MIYCFFAEPDVFIWSMPEAAATSVKEID